MKPKVKPAVIGAFVVGAFALAVAALLYFGGINFFSHPERFVVYFRESIEGLDLGSPVRLSGVRVGKVVDIHVLYDAKTNEPVIAVACDLDKNQIRDNRDEVIDVTKPGQLQQLIDRGLRAQLEVISLATGLLNVELDFYDPKAYPPQPVPWKSEYAVVPYVPSPNEEFKAIRANLNEVLSKVAKIDFEGLSNSLKALLVDTRAQVDGLDLKGAVAQWKQTGATLQGVIQSANLDKTLADFDTTLTDVRHTLASLDTQVDANGRGVQESLKNVDATLREFSATAVTLRRFVAAQQNLGDDANKALANLGQAAEAVSRLADFLERNPNALLTGKKPQ
jgi:paraquat-inducible protein B